MYSYLSEEWVTALVNDEFPRLIEKCRSALCFDQGTTDILNTLKETVEVTSRVQHYKVVIPHMFVLGVIGFGVCKYVLCDDGNAANQR